MSSPGSYHPANVYISADEAVDSNQARICAWSEVQLTQGVLAPVYLKVSSVQPNRGRGGWTFCFKVAEEPRSILRRKAEIIRELDSHQAIIEKEKAGQNRWPVIEALTQRVLALEWVLSRRDCL